MSSAGTGDNDIGVTAAAGWCERDRTIMLQALREARRAHELDEVPVGAVVAIGDEVVGCGFNRTVRDHDPSAHAEVVALREAAVKTGNHRLTEATVYVTLEPCLMCIGAMLHARIRRLVFGAYDPKAGALGSVFDLGTDRRLTHRIEVNGGLLGEECGALLEDFFAARR
jgi:tRNA(adenine34) deaminase